MRLYTSNMRYNGEDRFDITVKSGHRAFAPTWNMVMQYKRGEITEAQYTEQYLKRMEWSKVERNLQWLNLMSNSEVTLVCYCRPHTFCHRILLANILQKMNPAIKYLGERG